MLLLESNSRGQSAIEQVAKVAYKCPVCLEELNGSAIEILRHRKSHSQMQATEESLSEDKKENEDNKSLLPSF